MFQTNGLLFCREKVFEKTTLISRQQGLRTFDRIASPFLQNRGYEEERQDVDREGTGGEKREEGGFIAENYGKLAIQIDLYSSAFFFA